MSLNAGDDNMRGNSAKHVSGVAGSLVSMAIFVWPVMGAEIAAPIPDLSGQWGRNAFNFEVLSSGPHPVTNLRRTGDDAARAVIVGDPIPLVGDYTNPILKPEAAEVVKKKGELSLAGVTYPSPANQCWPEPVPFIFKNFGMMMLQRPQEIMILYDEGPDVRHVRMNQPHPAKLTPSWYGDSVGHYEGDTLVIDTVGTRTDGPFAMLDLYGTPYTKALHVVERYRLIDYEAAQEGLQRDAKENQRVPGDIDPNYRGKFLQVAFTVEDEGVFTTPWTGTITYRPARDPWQEIVCAENTHEYYYNKESEVPTAARPDF